MRKKLDDILRGSLQACFEKGELTECPLPEYVIEVPRNVEHGHFATNLPLTLAPLQKRSPRDVAHVILEHLKDEGNLIERAEVAGPGFINFLIRREHWYRVLSQIVARGQDYGRSTIGKGERVLVEFVSANPTGPLHLGHGRGAALGDTLCRVLSFTGHDVVREFYINDAGQQVRLLGESIYSRWMQSSEPDSPFPEDGYRGDYVRDLAEEIAGELDLKAMGREQAIERCAKLGKEKMLREIKKDLELFRVSFDVWTKESDLHDSGLLGRTLDAIRKGNQSYEKDGALWIRTSLFGDDKDRVIRKSDGQYTYFASDIAYHLDKWKRGFSKAINIWGADHHGYVDRMKAALKSNGLSEDWLAVLLIQLVKLWKGGEEIRMSKREGHYITLRELIEEVGVDAVRFVFLTKNHDSPLDFDIDLVKKQESNNPVYYVQYAHARICSIMRKAQAEGIELPRESDGLLERLVLDEELALIRMMAEFPSLLEDIALTLEPHRLTYYLTEIASLFHRYFNLGTRMSEHRVIGADTQLTKARLFMAEGMRILLYNGLNLLGVEAPEKM
ncbi:MAG: arginine--tRNA ligase [Deltaproteobacteria bacterium]|nr:arginine--tRNA ligase [Deltaproteobacteria bacterium]MBW2139160.1 arginine--tRNA ligase [Deltaproteobacteria bacterium]